MKGLKCRVDNILSSTAGDEHADLWELHAHRKDSINLFLRSTSTLFSLWSGLPDRRAFPEIPD